jgi:hypothetical protein
VCREYLKDREKKEGVLEEERLLLFLYRDNKNYRLAELENNCR